MIRVHNQSFIISGEKTGCTADLRKGGCFWKERSVTSAAQNMLRALLKMSYIQMKPTDIPYVSSHKQELVDRYTEIFTDLESR